MIGKHQILTGDVVSVLKTLPSDHFHCCVTSPPYWGLRDYGTASWEGGDAGCDHLGEPFRTKAKINQNCGTGNDVKHGDGRQPMGQTCSKCGAVRVDQQIGLEATPDLYIAKMVEVFREVRRVLRPDGTCWVNIGDSYSNDTKWGGTSGGKNYTSAAGGYQGQRVRRGKDCDPKRGAAAPGQPLACCNGSGLKPKDLVGIPWMLALALRADGWWLRQDIIWAKPNPIPESVTDRCTKAHEYVFLLTKSARYFCDMEAIKEPNSDGAVERFGKNPSISIDNRKHAGMDGDNLAAAATRMPNWLPSGRNARSVWSIATQPYPAAHFATYPEELPRRCILAGTSVKGCCPQCGKPWERVVERTDEPDASAKGSRFDAGKTGGRDGGDRTQNGERYVKRPTGWQSGCNCDPARDPAPCRVLDPFMGSGTTLAVACLHGRDAVGIELNPEYVQLAQDRIGKTLKPNTYVTQTLSGAVAGAAPLFMGVTDGA